MPAGGALNVLALEPYFGGRRREFVRLVQRHSRHRWDWRTLPARRMHRRLASAAGWFADELDRRPPAFGGAEGRPHVLFCSDAIYLNELLRLVPALSKLPRVMYIHDHGHSAVPAESREYQFSPRPTGIESIHLLSAVAATKDARGQLWFATSYHAAAFLIHADELYLANQRLFTDDPRRHVEAGARVVPPPVGDDGDVDARRQAPQRRQVLAAADASDGGAVSALFQRVMRREEPFALATIGQIPGLSGVPHTVIDPGDPAATAAAVRTSRAYLAAGRENWFDPWAVRAVRAGIWALVPGLGRESCYDEIVPRPLQAACFHDETPTRLLHLLQTAWHAARPELLDSELETAVAPFDPAGAVAAIDDRLERLVA